MGSIVENRPHAVAIPIPLQGHITPLMHLCTVLASRGFIITFINTESNQEKMKGLSVDGLDIFFETVPDGLPVPVAELEIFRNDNRVMFFDAIQAMEKAVEQLLREKVQKEMPPITCLISDLFFKWSRELAGRLGVPNVIFWTASASSLVLDSSLPLLLENGDIPVEDPSKEDVITYLPGLSPFPVWGLPAVYSAHDAAFDPGFKRRYGRTCDIGKDAWVLINGVEEMEERALEAVRTVNPNSISVGPLLLSSASTPSLWREDKHCLEWLDRQEPESVLYISFGSIATITFEQFLEVEAGLEELRKPFLWAIRPKSVSNMQMEVFEAFKSRVQEGGFGMIIAWAPQQQVLMHPSVGGFLTHCGWNSTLESISAGVPIICWPCVAEQNLNCKMIVQDWQVGVKFAKVVYRELVTKDEFVDVVRNLMVRSHELRSNARKLKAIAHRAVSPGGSSDNNLQRFIDSMKAK